MDLWGMGSENEYKIYRKKYIVLVCDEDKWKDFIWWMIWMMAKAKALI